MNRANVLITSAGGASAINVIQTLKSQNEIPVRLVAVDINARAAGLFLADVGHTVPRASDSSFIPTILDLCQKEDINVVIPILSVEMPVFTAHSDEFGRRGIGMVISSLETVKICSNKWLTSRFFAESGIPAPQTWVSTDLPKRNELPYPLIVKPNVGSGSRNTYRASTPEQLEALLPLVPDPVIQEFIQGQEYTIDLFSDWQSNLLAAIPRERVRTSGGKSILARTVSDEEILGWVQKIVKQSKLVGAGNIQCFRGADGLGFTEINTRFAAGGLPLCVAAGANTPLMYLRLALRQPVIPVWEYVEGLVMVRYFTELFLEQDSAENYRRARGPV